MNRNCKREREREQKITEDQKVILVEFMEDYPDFASNKLTGLGGTMSKNDMWEVLTTRLNSVGPPKAAAQWKRTWIHLKNKIKKKAAHIQNTNEPGLRKILSEVEERIINITQKEEVNEIEVEPLNIILDSDDITPIPSAPIQPSNCSNTKVEKFTNILKTLVEQQKITNEHLKIQNEQLKIKNEMFKEYLELKKRKYK